MNSRPRRTSSFATHAWVCFHSIKNTLAAYSRASKEARALHSFLTLRASWETRLVFFIICPTDFLTKQTSPLRKTQPERIGATASSFRRPPRPPLLVVVVLLLLLLLLRWRRLRIRPDRRVPVGRIRPPGAGVVVPLGTARVAWLKGGCEGRSVVVRWMQCAGGKTGVRTSGGG